MSMDIHENGAAEGGEEEEQMYADDVLEVVEAGDDIDMDEDDDGGDIGEEDGSTAGASAVASGPDTSTARFSGHGNSAVFAVALHPSLAEVCASGGEDDGAYVWDARDGTVLGKVEGHSDSVVSLRWSQVEEEHGGRLLATGGMDGKVHVTRVADTGGQVVCEPVAALEGPEEVVWVDWHPRGTVLLAGGSDGTVWMWQLPQGRVMHVFAGHSAPVTAGLFTSDGKHIVTVSEDSKLIVWDPPSGASLFRVDLSDSPFPFPSPSSPTAPGGAASLALVPPSLAVVGATNAGAVAVVNIVNGTVVESLKGHDASEGVSVEAVQYIDGGAGAKGLIVSGGTDGKVCIWETANYKLRSVLTHQDAITSLALSRSSPPRLASATAAGEVKTWDVRTGANLADHTGHAGAVHQVAWSAGGDWLASCGDDGAARIFRA